MRGWGEVSGPEGTPNGVDRLALAPAWVLFLPSDEQEYVLALVEIAKAARAAEKYVLCVTDPPCGDCDACRFHAALARLDSEGAK
jgi:hypothetical protein